MRVVKGNDSLEVAGKISYIQVKIMSHKNILKVIKYFTPIF